ncbi:MAG: phage holin family protein [Candidatus Gracilibacteria bacterium]|nr:phage holin family protein [Candidatus Gracilibacteria bacterium]
MKIFLSILFNALILFALTYLLGMNPDKGVEAGIIVEGGIKTYIIGGALLGLINITIKPILKILSLPLFFVFLGLVAFIVNGIVLWLLDYIFNEILVIPGITYTINGGINFIIAVAIFTILNMFYTILFSKK